MANKLMLDTPDVPCDPQQEVLVDPAALHDLLVRLYVRAGMFKTEAEIAATRQLEADLRGIHSHGSRATPRYLRAIEVGDIDPRGQVITLKKTPAIALLDGGRSMGHVASTRAMQLAIEMARDVGTGTVAVCRSQHYGAASVYALMAAQAGMIGYSTTSTGPATVAAYGSPSPATANNAFAWAAPARNGDHFCLDMACAVSSWGKLDSCKLYGLPIPPQWALDATGQPTTDPATAKVLLPAAGARGYGLALQCAILAGPLASGRMPLHKTRHPETEGSEHFFYAIDIAQFVDLDRFQAELDQTFAEIRALTPAQNCDRVRIPGDLEAHRARDFASRGIPLHRAHLAELEAVAARSKIPVPWTPAQPCP